MTRRSFSPTRRAVAVAAVASTSLALVAACGTSSPSASSPAKGPSGSVQDAYGKLLDGKSLTMTFKLDESAADLIALDRKDPSSDPLTPAQAQTIAGGTIVVAEKVDKGSLKAPAAGAQPAFGITVNAGDAPKLVELVYVDKTTYARADVQQFVKYGALSSEQLSDFTTNTPPQLAFLKDAAAGKWLKLPAQDLLDFAKTESKQSAVPSADPSQAAALEKALTNVFTTDFTVTQAGSDPLGDHYVLSGSSRKIATDLVAAVKGQLGAIPGADKTFNDVNPADVPEKTVTLDAYVKSGKLSAVKVDLSQFASGKDLADFGGKPFYLEADFADSATVSAPANATAVSFGALIGGLTALDSSSGPAT